MAQFRSYDALRLFVIVARHLSFTAAAAELNLTKGAVSYQIKQLERELNFALFDRVHQGIVLTEKGGRLRDVAQSSFDDIEQNIAAIGQQQISEITVGASTYFASRWLASRLMTFISDNPAVRLRLQPVIGLGDLKAEKLDLMIRWGKADWDDAETELLFNCPAGATAGRDVAEMVEAIGLEAALPELTLLHDCEGSTAWQQWYEAAGLDYRPKQDPLVIPDPNVRVEAVINGQGIALNDALISAEIDANRLYQISPIELSEYGYFLAYGKGSLNNPILQAFREWILSLAT